MINIPHPFMPQQSGDYCGHLSCGESWDSSIHRPASWLALYAADTADVPDLTKQEQAEADLAKSLLYDGVAAAREGMSSLAPHPFKGGLYDDCSVCGQGQPYPLHRPPIEASDGPPVEDEDGPPPGMDRIKLDFPAPMRDEFIGVIRKFVLDHKDLNADLQVAAAEAFMADVPVTHEEAALLADSLIPPAVAEAIAEGLQREAEANEFFGSLPDDDERERMSRVLGDWWMSLAEAEVSAVVPKAVEYGALDLIDIGHDLARTAGRVVSDEEAAEMGVYFYIRGKLARWTDALVRNDRPSDDTLHDLGVYVRMAQRIRAAGGWPGL